MRVLAWLVRGFLFFTLFAFALNNLQPVSVNWFFGLSSQAPLVMVVLVAFAVGGVAGVLSMLPGWWRQRRQAQLPQGGPLGTVERPATAGDEAAVLPLVHPPRDGL